MNKPSVMHVARKIIEMSDDNPTPMKLQKLAYYSQAWFLVWENDPLFDEDFQAWANGPVNPELYAKHKGLFSLNDDFLSEHTGFSFTQPQLHAITEIIKFYGTRDAFFLSGLTHAERPWKDARGSTPPGAISHNVISKESMLDYYTGISA